MMHLLYVFAAAIIGVVIALLYINNIVSLTIGLFKRHRRTYTIHITGYCPKNKDILCSLYTINRPHTLMRSIKRQLLDNSKCSYHDNHWYYSIDDNNVWAFLIVCNIEVGQLKRKGIKEIAINIDGAQLYKEPIGG